MKNLVNSVLTVKAVASLDVTEDLKKEDKSLASILEKENDDDKDEQPWQDNNSR